MFGTKFGWDIILGAGIIQPHMLYRNSNMSPITSQYLRLITTLWIHLFPKIYLHVGEPSTEVGYKCVGGHKRCCHWVVSEVFN